MADRRVKRQVHVEVPAEWLLDATILAVLLIVFAVLTRT